MSRRWSAIAPWGRVGHALGFRWVFPIGTLSVPWHPAFLPLVLAAMVVWTTAKVVGLATGTVDGAGGAVVGLSTGFAVVVVLLSVPVLAWFVLALGGRLVQALLALAAMVVLSVSVASGEDPWWLAALPVAYVATWAVQALGGRIVLARLRRTAARFFPVDVRGRTVVLPADVASGAAADVLFRGGAGAVWQRSGRSGDGGTARVAVTDDQAAELREVARDALPSGVSLEEEGGRTMLCWTGALPGGDAVVLTTSRRPDPWGLVGRQLWRVEVDGRSVVTGSARVVLPVPLLNVFYWVSLTSSNEWVVGFGRGRGRPVGPGGRNVHGLVGDGAPLDPVTNPETIAALDLGWRRVADRDLAVGQLRTAALEGHVDLSAHQLAHDELRRHGPRLLGADASSVLATWMGHARTGRHPREPAAVARLVASLNDEEITADGDRWVEAFNSRKLALRWRLTPDLDVAPLPRELYRFGDHAGFGLALEMPSLYVRLGDLLPRFRPMVAELDDEMPLGDEVERALRRWGAGRMDRDVPGTGGTP